jgi:hypothetical protein
VDRRDPISYVWDNRGHARRDHGLPNSQPAGAQLQPAAVVRGGSAQVSAAFVGIATEMGEPFLSRFLPREIDQLFRRHGFGETADFGPEDAPARYFAGRTKVDLGRAERIITAAMMRLGHFSGHHDADRT